MGRSVLLNPAQWKGSGAFWDENGNKMAGNAHLHVSHGEENWAIESNLAVVNGPSFKSVYSLAPVGADDWRVTWEAQNEALGQLMGEFLVLDETVLSRFTTPGGTARGVECLSRVSAKEIRWSGALYVDGRLAGGWEVKLVSA